MTRKAIVGLITLATISAAPSLAHANPSSIDLAFTARRAVNDVRLSATGTFSEATTSVCDASLVGTVSTVGASKNGKRKTLITRRLARGSTSVTFRALSPAVKYKAPTQTQLNLQIRLKCGNRTVVSEAVAENVTCSRGIDRGRFFTTLNTRFFR